jgi:hypothetical protein
MAHRPGLDQPDLTDRILWVVAIVCSLIAGVCIALFVNVMIR